MKRGEGYVAVIAWSTSWVGSGRLGTRLVAPLKILKEAKNGEAATLTVDALGPDKAKTTGTIEILKEGGAWQGKLVVRPLTALLLAAAARAAMAQDGTASGRLTLNGETVALKYAYANAQPGFFDKSSEDVRVLLSDVPLPEAARTDVFERIHLGQDGAARIVEVVVDAERQPISGAIYAPAFEGTVSMAGMHRFEAQRFDRTGIAGRLFVVGAHEFGGVTFEYDATFKADIPRPPSAEQVAADLASPPAQAAAAWLAAVRDGRLQEILDLLAPDEAARWRDSAGRARLARLRTETPPDSRVVSLARPTPQTAVATVNGSRASDGVVVESTLALALVDGAWKVTP